MTRNKDAEQVRGPELREKMIESEEKGENFRSQNHGPDQRIADVGDRTGTHGRSQVERSKK